MVGLFFAGHTEVLGAARASDSVPGHMFGSLPRHDFTLLVASIVIWLTRVEGENFTTGALYDIIGVCKHHLCLLLFNIL